MNQEPPVGSTLNRLLYTVRDTESLLSISHATIYRLLNSGRLDGRRIGGRTVITAESISILLAGLPKVARLDDHPVDASLAVSSVIKKMETVEFANLGKSKAKSPSERLGRHGMNRANIEQC